MNIMHVIDSLNVGGAERMLVEIANATRRDGHPVSVCVTRDGREMAGELTRDVPVHVLGRTRRIDLAALRRYATLVKESKTDIVHAHGRSTFSFLLFAKSLGFFTAPIVLHDHYGEIEIDTSIPGWFRWYGHRLVGEYVGVSQNLVDWACSAGVPATHAHVILNALDLERVRRAKAMNLHKEFGTRKDCAIGVTVCGLRREKGIHVLLEALERCHCRGRVQVLVVGGDRDVAYATECREKAKSLGLANVVVFLGERRDVLSIIRGADFAILPSLSESGPLTIIEYVASGLPLVASRTGGIARRAESCGVEGFVAPGDVDALARGIGELLTLSSADFRRRGEFGVRVARENFEIRKTMSKWYRVYDSAAAG